MRYADSIFADPSLGDSRNRTISEASAIYIASAHYHDEDSLKLETGFRELTPNIDCLVCYVCFKLLSIMKLWCDELKSSNQVYWKWNSEHRRPMDTICLYILMWDISTWRLSMCFGSRYSMSFRGKWEGPLTGKQKPLKGDSHWSWAWKTCKKLSKEAELLSSWGRFCDCLMPVHSEKRALIPYCPT